MNYGKQGVKNKRRALNSKSVKWGKKLGITIVELLLIAFIAVVIIGASAGIGVFKGIIATAPDISNINVTPSGYSTFVYDNKGNQIAKLVSTDSNRIPVTMAQVPQNLADAFVAIEDERFYEHNGIDVMGIIRAGVTGLRNGRFSEGASTITQQLLKNNVFTEWTSENSMVDKFRRKFQEQYLALELEKVMSKEDILINYMNTINLGQNTLGVQAASLRYFGKDVSQLTLSECAVIASITQNPSKLNPISRPENNAERRDKVLRNMLKQGYISQAEYDTAMADDVYSRIQLVDAETTDDTINSYFVDALTEDVLEDLVKAGYTEQQAFTLLYSGGLKIYSTQDPDIQGICDDIYNNEENYPANVKWYLNYTLTVERSDGTKENSSTEMFRNYFREQNKGFNLIYASKEDAYADIETYKEYFVGGNGEVFDENITLTPQPQVSLTVEDQSTGYIVAMIGGRGAKSASRTLNRATSAARQPGSTFKIVSTYVPALDSAGLTLATVQNDAPFNYQNGTPVRNWYGEKYRGLCSLRDGIRDSLNIVAVKTLTKISPQLGFDYLINLGFTTLVEQRVASNGQVFSDITQSLSLGGVTDGVTNEELNASYACIANGGVYIKPKLYTKIVDHDGNLVLDNSEPESRRVMKETTAYLLTDAMEDVVTSGTGGSCNFGGTAIAGKTGTTSDYNDVWFAGYTTYYTATTWTGYDNNVKLTGDEKNLSKKLWRLVMSQIHADLPGTSFPVPSGIVTATVCAKSGKLPIAGLCDQTLRTEYFAEGTVPTDTCDVHYQGFICPYDNCPATEMCPFKYFGVTERLPMEDSSLLSGSSTTVTTVDENGLPIEATVGARSLCTHDELFFSNPNYEAVIEQQRAEMQQRTEAAIAAAIEAGIDPATIPETQPHDATPPEGYVPGAIINEGGIVNPDGSITPTVQESITPTEAPATPAGDSSTPAEETPAADQNVIVVDPGAGQ